MFFFHFLWPQEMENHFKDELWENVWTSFPISIQMGAHTNILQIGAALLSRTQSKKLRVSSKRKDNPEIRIVARNLQNLNTSLPYNLKLHSLFALPFLFTYILKYFHIIVKMDIGQKRIKWKNKLFCCRWKLSRSIQVSFPVINILLYIVSIFIPCVVHSKHFGGYLLGKGWGGPLPWGQLLGEKECKDIKWEGKK